MRENIKTFCLVIITICVFVIAVLDILNVVKENDQLQMPVPQINLNDRQPSLTGNSNSNISKTSVSFDEMKFDFGDLKEGDIVHHTFLFKNNGDNPLIITNAIGSCGCTVPTYPKDPIAPGEIGKIEVQFNSKGKEGLQNKTVTVTANTEPANTVLTITSNVSK